MTDTKNMQNAADDDTVMYTERKPNIRSPRAF